MWQEKTPFDVGNRLGYAVTDLFLVDLAFAGLGKLGTAGKVAKSFNYAADVGRYGDEVADLARYGDEIADVNKIVDGPDYSDIGKHFDEVQSNKTYKNDVLADIALRKAAEIEDLIKNIEYYGGDEIAEELWSANKSKGRVLRFEPKVYNDLKVPENFMKKGHVEEYLFHEVYSTGKYVIDPRYSSSPVLETDYIKMMRKMNPDVEIKSFNNFSDYYQF